MVEAVVVVIVVGSGTTPGTKTQSDGLGGSTKQGVDEGAEPAPAVHSNQAPSEAGP